ncbi:MAG: hypothetical protein ACE5HE_14005, partial [Phycisphaerae bacterium]
PFSAKGPPENSSLAEKLVDTQEQLNLKAQRVSEELTDKADATTASIEAGERLLQEFITRSSELQRQLNALQRKVASLEKSLEDATAEPKHIVASARAQSAQLERVCTAVRKVFAGLARTTLDAKRQAEECRSMTGQADERLRTLTAETDRASATLREWVSEAVRAQGRLDASLQRCPTIDQTHAGESLAAVSQIARPLSGSASEAADRRPIKGEGLDASAPAREEGACGTPESTRPRTTVAEINQLIQEARSASVRAAIDRPDATP